jgi:hydrogenase maturation protease
MTADQQIGILGVGNLLLGDEGFGVHVLRRLQEQYRFPENVELLDGGTSGIMLAPFIESKDALLVIDVVNLAEEPGTIHVYENRDVRAGNIQTRMSPHQVGLLEILDLCRLRGNAPDWIEMITVVPADLSTRIGLSPALEQAVEPVIEMVLQRVPAIGPRPGWEQSADSGQGLA